MNKGFERTKGGGKWILDTVAPFAKEGNATVVSSGFWSKVRMLIFDPCAKSWGAVTKAAGKLPPSAWAVIGIGGFLAVLAGKLITDTYPHVNDSDELHQTSLESIPSQGIHLAQLGLAVGALFSALKFSKNVKGSLAGMGTCMGLFLATTFMKWKADKGNPINTDAYAFPFNHGTHQFRNPRTWYDV